MKRLTLIGLGISNERSVTLQGLDRMREADAIFAEFFTSMLEEGSLGRLEEIVGKRIILLDRREVEEEELVIGAFDESDRVCLLTAGDPLTATTHQELRFDAIGRGIEVEIVHSASIFHAAAGLAGLQHYKFGRTTTLPFPEGDFLPTSPLDIVMENMERGLHTLVLLDIQADRSRYMTASEGCGVLLRMELKRRGGMIGEATMAVAVLRAGRKDWKVIYGEIGKLKGVDMGAPPHCLMIPGNLHFAEQEALDHFKV
ncbi:MAG: diphthine synthase [Candidatus Thermoplasmatota archaeon]|nr:diphthine synthase [Candidatus Thermoplasmatota archaeon]